VNANANEETAMYCVSIAYPNKESARFDFDYFAQKHIPLVTGHLAANAVKSEVRKGLSSPDGSPAAFTCMANIWIRSLEEFRGVMAEHGREIMADVPNYTDIEPILQIDEVLD